MRYFILIVLLMLVFDSYAAELGRVEKEWLSMIEAEIGEGCIKRGPEVEYTVVGFNGLRHEAWVLQTCKGSKRYYVSYYPAAQFPDRKSEFEVIEKE